MARIDVVLRSPKPGLRDVWQQVYVWGICLTCYRGFWTFGKSWVDFLKLWRWVKASATALGKIFLEILLHVSPFDESFEVAWRIHIKYSQERGLSFVQSGTAGVSVTISSLVDYFLQCFAGSATILVDRQVDNCLFKIGDGGICHATGIYIRGYLSRYRKSVLSSSPWELISSKAMDFDESCRGDLNIA